MALNLFWEQNATINECFDPLHTLILRKDQCDSVKRHKAASPFFAFGTFEAIVTATQIHIVPNTLYTNTFRKQDKTKFLQILNLMTVTASAVILDK